MYLKAIAVKDYGPFNGQSAFYFKKGLSVIYGLNKTDGANSKNSNWVGKSLFFSSLSEVLYDEPVVGTKNDKLKQGSRAVILTDDQNTVQIIRQYGKRDSVKIIENNTPIEHLTKTKANEYIKSKWLLNKAEFETFVHIDSRIPHPLVMGSSSERKHFFDSFFKLSQIDDERKLYLRALRDIESSKQAFDELLNVYKQQKKGLLSRDERAKLKKELKTLKAKQKENARSFELINRYNQLKTVYDSVKDKLSTVDIDSIESEIKSIKDSLTELKSEREKCAEYKAYLVNKKQYDELLTTLSDLAKNTSLAKLSKGSQLWLKYSEQLTEASDTVQSVDLIKPIKPQGERGDVQALMVSQSKLEDMLRQSLKFKSGVCPTCGQPVKTHSVSDIKRELVEVGKKLNQAKLWVEFDKQKESYLEAKAQKERIEKQIESLTEKVKKFEPYRSAYKERAKLPDEPIKVERPTRTTKQVQALIEQKESRLVVLRSIEPHVETIKEYLSWTDITSFDYDSYNSCNERIAKTEALLNLHSNATDQIKQTKKRLLELKAELKDEPYLKKLVEIFSDKKMKRVMVQQISEKLCQLMNKYSALVFNQEYTFELIWDSQLQLLCTRRVGKQKLTSDVRKLSGAESKLFTIILVLSLLSFVPSAKRPSVMILDEPSANFSAETTQAFIKLLDVLKQVVPSIVIITPRDDVYPDSMPYTIVRTKEGSKIVQGLPDQVNIKL